MTAMTDEEKETVEAGPQPAARGPQGGSAGGESDAPSEETRATVAGPAIDEGEESNGYKVTLPSFHGPLDLLLHLIKKHEIDIYDIPIALVTEQYNAYLDAMQELDLEVAADFIYMAAVLINIKSKMLLPRDESEEAAEDPRKELVDRLLEYQRFKAVAESFAELDVVRMGMWSRPPVPLPGNEPTEIDMSEVSLFDLIDSFRTALSRYKEAHPQAIELQRTVHKVSEKMAELYTKARERTQLRLGWFLEGRGRDELIALFLAMLELVRLGGVALHQSETFGEIVIAPTESEIDPATFKLYDD